MRYQTDEFGNLNGIVPLCDGCDTPLPTMTDSELRTTYGWSVRGKFRVLQPGYVQTRSDGETTVPPVVAQEGNLHLCPSCTRKVDADQRSASAATRTPAESVPEAEARAQPPADTPEESV